jgi:hypothetical protein
LHRAGQRLHVYLGDRRAVEFGSRALRQSERGESVVRRDVVAQLPRASREIEMGMTVEIEVGEIRNRLGRSVS